MIIDKKLLDNLLIIHINYNIQLLPVKPHPLAHQLLITILQSLILPFLEYRSFYLKNIVISSNCITCMHVIYKAELYITDDNTGHPQEADKTDQFFVGKADN